MKITKNGLQFPLFSQSQENLNMSLKMWKLEFRSIVLTNLGPLLKDNLPTSSQMNVVYKLNSKDCNVSYVGQTSRLLKTFCWQQSGIKIRITEHKSHINRNTTVHSVITDHRISLSHEFDWENVEILDRERYLTKRLISEMLHSKRQKNSLNLHTDTECLDNGIDAILNKL